MKSFMIGWVSLILCTAAYAFSYTIELTEAEIQAKAESMMPLEKKKLFITTVISNPIVKLISSTNQIGLTTDVKVNVLGNISSHGKVSFAGALRYESTDGTFFFDDLSIVDLTLAKVPPKSLPKIKRVLENVAQKFLAAHPIYKFKDDNVKHKLAKASLKSIRVESNVLMIELGLF